jgi:hypothetical protein
VGNCSCRGNQNLQEEVNIVWGHNRGEHDSAAEVGLKEQVKWLLLINSIIFSAPSIILLT